MAKPTPDDTRRGAPAAQPDLLGGAARNDGTLEPLREDGAAPAADPARPAGAQQPRREDSRAQERGAARPGVDENQAGFVKDEDKRFRP
jgi:hypothetical protein